MAKDPLKEAKALSIKLWQYLVDHPNCRCKEDTPFWEQLEAMKHNCPLCAVIDCPTCPIYIEGRGCYLYKRWAETDPIVSAWAAREILVRVKEWQL